MSSHEIHALRERAKELQCLYRIHEILSRRGEAPAHTFLEVLEAIPLGWQRPVSTGARIEYLGRSYVGPGYSSTGEAISEAIRLNGVKVGQVEVAESSAPNDGRPAFLDEERELLRNIARRLGEYLEWKHTELLGERAGASGVHWRWREAYASALASALDGERFGVSEIFLGGSAGSGEAGPGSDIDLVVVFHGSESQRAELNLWLEGWSRCLGELAFQQTGYAFPDGILSVRWLDASPDLRRSSSLTSLPIRGARSGPST